MQDKKNGLNEIKIIMQNALRNDNFDDFDFSMYLMDSLRILDNLMEEEKE